MASNTQISTTGTLNDLPKNTAVITGINPEYMTNTPGDTFYNYEINYDGVTNTLVIPSTVEKDGVQYTIIGVNLSVGSKDRTAVFPNVENIIFPNTIKSINGANGVPGYDLSKVKNVVLPKYITSLPDGMFMDCTNLKSVNIPNNVTEIGSQAFMNCKSLTSVSIHDDVTSIASAAFYNCISLESIEIPSGVNRISRQMFEGCSALSSINLPDNLIEIEGAAFKDCKNLKKINIPDGVISIGSNAFAAAGVEEIIIPENMSVIEEGAFQASNIKTIYIPKNVTEIGFFAFNAVSTLKNVNYEGSKEEWQKIKIGDGNNGLNGPTFTYNYKLETNN